MADSQNYSVLDPADADSYGAALRGRVVIITGAGSGFGREYAIKAAQLGAKVVLSDLRPGPVNSLAEEIIRNGGTATAFAPCDTANWDQQVAMFKHARATYGHIDSVFPNAGVGEIGEWLVDELDKDGELVKPALLTVKINLLGAAQTTKLALYHLRQNPAAHKSIVLIGSMYSYRAIPAGGQYTMAKHGILGLFRSLYHEASESNINVNILSPWFCETAIIAPLTRVAIFGLPLCSIEDVVSCVVRAASDKSMTGNTLFVDATGVVKIPFEGAAVGGDGYFAELGRRGIYESSPRRLIKDTGLFARQILGVILSGLKGRVALLAFIGWSLRRLRQQRGP